MAAQRILLALAVLAALALLFLAPRVFEETDEADVPPVELRRDVPAEERERSRRRADERSRRARERRRAERRDRR
ncbi:MAG: hypothetical protein ACRDPC_06765, partial [Solirubrobacteraceae bacterium]